MKKIFTLFAAAAVALSVSAEEFTPLFGNPLDANGEVIVKYDLVNDTWAASNDFEIDETICFAIDATGSEDLINFLNGTPRDPNVIGRSLGFAFYTTDVDGASGGANIDGRMWKIKGNIYGMIINLFQLGTSRYLDGWFGPNADFTEYAVTTVGTKTAMNTPVFGFGYSAENPGAEWWQVPQEGKAPFTTLAYTGTKTSPVFYKEDTDALAPEFFAGSFGDWAGYAAPTLAVWNAVNGGSGIEGVAANASEVKVEYYNIQGQLVNEAAKGLMIRKATLSDGSVKATKIFK